MGATMERARPENNTLKIFGLRVLENTDASNELLSNPNSIILHLESTNSQLFLIAVRSKLSAVVLEIEE